MIHLSKTLVFIALLSIICAHKGKDTPSETVQEVHTPEEGKNVFLEIEVQGAAKIKQLCPEAIFIFVMPPDMHELTRRLVDRNTEDQHTIEVRLSNAKREIEQAKNYDYIIVNHTIEEAVKDLTAIVRSAKCTYDHMKNFINEVLKDA